MLQLLRRELGLENREMYVSFYSFSALSNSRMNNPIPVPINVLGKVEKG